MGVTFISYAFNLNLGSLVGGVAFRYRLYSRLGLGNETITRVLGFSMFTNWIGYLLVAGVAFCFWPLDLPPGWKIGNDGLRMLGAVLLMLAFAYVLLCAFVRGRVWRVRGHAFKTPGLAMALLQLAMSCANWSLIGGVIWFLLQGAVGYPHVLAVLLVAAVAGVVTHVPAGLGVLEAVFVALLAHQVPEATLLGALLAYRGLYYLLPLTVATLGYLAQEGLAGVGLLDVRVREVLHPQRHFVLAALAEAAADAQHLGELEGGAEAAIGRAVDVVHQRAADAAFGEQAIIRASLETRRAVQDFDVGGPVRRTAAWLAGSLDFTEADAARFERTENGVVLVTREMLKRLAAD
eukprot:gene42758-56839_t